MAMKDAIDRSWDVKGADKAVFADSLTELFNSLELCTVSTATPDGDLHSNTAFFAAVPSTIDLVMVFEADSKHADNANKTKKASIAVYSSDQKWGGNLHGCWLSGLLEPVPVLELPSAMAIYGKRFATSGTLLKQIAEHASAAASSRLYVFVPQEIRVYDSARIGDLVAIAVKKES